MSHFRAPAWLPIVGVLATVAGALSWLLFVFAGNQTGMLLLAPDVPAGDVFQAEFLRDQSQQLDLATVAQQPPDAWRTRQNRSVPVTVAPGDALWARVTVRNPTDRAQPGILANQYLFADHLDLWVPTAAGWRHLRNGEALSAREKALPGRDLAFPLTVPAGGELRVYLRADDHFFATMALAWWPEQADFHAARARALLAEGLYLGGLLALLSYNTLLWLRLRLADIGYYVLYLGASAVFMLLARSLGPALGWTLGSPHLETTLVLTLVGSMFFLTHFARTFLELDARAPRVARWVRRGGWLLLLIAPGAIVTPDTGIWMRVTVLVSAATHIGLFALALWSWRAGVWQARFFVMAFGCLFSGSLTMVLAWIFSYSAQQAAMMGLMIGSALEMLLLSLATAERFAQAQRDKTLAQERLVAETEQRRLIEETYADELEIEVCERTRELAEANADKDRILAIVGHDLRSPLTGLMRAADTTSGDFARETARTGRTLLLLIEDLVLWARLRAGTHHISAHTTEALLGPAVALHRSLAERDGTTLLLEMPAGLRVETDLVLAQTLVRNLLANALKFARTQVVLRATAEAGGVRFTVANDGPALPPEVAARFAAGQDEPMTATGGLGLRLCREICGALGLTLAAHSGTTGGTEFTFVLPSPAPEKS